MWYLQLKRNSFQTKTLRHTLTVGGNIVFILTWTFHEVSRKCSSSFVCDMYSVSSDSSLGGNNSQWWNLGDSQALVLETGDCCLRSCPAVAACGPVWQGAGTVLFQPLRGVCSSFGRDWVSLAVGIEVQRRGGRDIAFYEAKKMWLSGKPILSWTHFLCQLSI